jgi:hypothetical protein
MHLLRILLKVVKVLVKTLFRVGAVLGFLFFIAFVVLMFSMSSRDVDPAMTKLVHSAASEGKIAYGLTTPQELEELLGVCECRTRIDFSGRQDFYLDYPGGVHGYFMGDGKNSFSLVKLTIGGTNFQIGNLFRETFGGRYVDIGYRRSTVLMNEGDLKKLNSFTGLQGKSLANLDLRGHKETLEKMRFDTRTLWPEPNRMPEGFDPAALLEAGKNPGLGIRALHEQGVDGSGVGIAIIDQPLLRNHIEYADRIVRYEPKSLTARFLPAQMHGAPVASIAVGKNCGIAPGAALYYFAVPTWSWLDNRPWADLLDEIIQLNGTLKDSEKIRVVSISLGAFSERQYFNLWKETVEKAEQDNILVVTCDPAFLKYGTLERISNTDADDPLSYKAGRYSARDAALKVPAGGRTTASHQGPEVYTYWTDSGMSWAVPYLAGLAALAYQVNPEIKPDEIVKLWVETAVKTDEGPIVNPRGFIEVVRKLRLQGQRIEQ